MYRRMILASAVSLALAPAGVQALGLGELQADSALNQPFLGEIELLDADVEELDTIRAELASEAEFEKVGAERYFFLTKLRFNPQIAPDGQPIIRVSSRDPIREPFLNFLVEVNSPDGRLVREYTVLLDPPVVSEGRSRRPANPPVATAPAASPAPNAGGPVAIPDAASGVDFPRYSEPVPAGAGLLRVAREMRPRGASVAQTALALYRSNQNAFIGGDINRLRVGETLAIPSAAELFVLDQDVAARQLAAALAGQRIADAPLTRPDEAVAGEPDEAAAAAPDEAAAGEPQEGGRLRIAAPDEAGETAGSPDLGGDAQAASTAAGGPLEEELLLVRETSESTRQETEDLRARIRQLEAQLADIQSLLVLRNEQLAELQLAEAVAAEDAAPGEPPGAAEPGEAPSGAGGEDGLGAESSPASAAAEESPGASAPVADPPLAAEEPGVPSAEGTEPAGAPPALEQVAPDAEPEAVSEPEAVASQPEGPTEAEGAQSPAAAAEPPAGDAEAEEATEPAPVGAAPWPLIGLGLLVLALIGAAVWYMLKRRRRMANSLQLDSGFAREDAGAPATPAVATPATAPVGALAAAAPAEESQRAGRERGEAGAADEEDDADAESVQHTSSLRAFDDDTDVDVFSEADIYIAYGRYREAEKLLREELDRHPGRLDLQFKLAEVLFGRQEYEGFAALVDEMQAAGAEEGNPEQWRRVTAMLASLRGNEAEAGAEDQTPASPPDEDPSSRSAAGEPQTRPAPRGGAPYEAAPPSRDEAEASPSAAHPTASAAPAASAAASTEGGAEQPPAEWDLDLDDLLGPAPAIDQQGAGERPSRSAPGSVPESAPRSAPSPAPQAAPPPPPPEPAPEPAKEETRSASGDFDFGDDELSLGSVDWYGASGRGERAQPTPQGQSEAPAQPGLGGGGPGRGLDDLLIPAEDVERRAQAERAAEDAATSGFSFVDDSAAEDSPTASWPHEDSGPWDEVATKLDLARAYLEMRDTEAARTILAEVAEEGDEAQREEARRMLEGLP